MNKSLTHVDSGLRCAVYHSDGSSCAKCANCQEWLKQENMGDLCPGRDEQIEQENVSLPQTKCPTCKGTGKVFDPVGALPEIRNQDGTLKHITAEGSRQHVVSWSSKGMRCSEPECEINSRDGS